MLAKKKSQFSCFMETLSCAKLEISRRKNNFQGEIQVLTENAKSTNFLEKPGEKLKKCGEISLYFSRKKLQLQIMDKNQKFFVS